MSGDPQAEGLQLAWRKILSAEFAKAVWAETYFSEKFQGSCAGSESSPSLSARELRARQQGAERGTRPPPPVPFRVPPASLTPPAPSPPLPAHWPGMREPL